MQHARYAMFLALAHCIPVAAQAQRPPVDSDALSFQIVFGERQIAERDYSGTITLSSGAVTRIEPWRFHQGDSVDGARGWKLRTVRRGFENQPDRPRHMQADPRTENVVPAGVWITADAPSSATATVATAQGEFQFRLADLRPGNNLPFLDGDVLVRRTPTPAQVSGPSSSEPAEQMDYPSLAETASGDVWFAWQGYHDLGDHVYARKSSPSGWSETFRLTGQKGDVLRTAIGEDGQGRIWVVWSERDGRFWDLWARYYNGSSWSSRVRISARHHPNLFHRMAAGNDGSLHLVWVGHEGGESYVYWSRLRGDDWAEPQKISGPSAWMPEAAADSKGNLWIAWDSYRNGNYDIFLRRVGADGQLGEEIQVTESPQFQAAPAVAVDKQDRVWLAWHESGANWGKDWTHEDRNRAVTLYANRMPRVAVYDGASWKQPAMDLSRAAPDRYNRYLQNPRIAADGEGRIWLGLQIRTAAGHTRSDFWAMDGRWEFFLTSFDGAEWAPLTPVPRSSLRPEGTLLLAPRNEGVWLAWVNDNRPIAAPGFYARIPNQHEILAAAFDGANPAARETAFHDFQEAAGYPPWEFRIHPDETAEVERIRNYRTAVNGRELRILRGDFHRHTEISTDGSGDGSLEDYFRYMIDAASMDTGIVGDHNAGNDDEYMWWRTEKYIDVFLIAGRYTPMFGYERSASYPNGHRNVVFAQRGVPTLPLPADEARGQIDTGPILYPHLRRYNGICMSHSTATSQGTDFRDWDPQLEPLVELYQGYHASYEYPGAPRAESAGLRVLVHGRYEPAGFWWSALENGRKLGVQASSDHISNHASYTVIYSPTATREDILESMRARHAYAATDNIILDVQAETSGGRRYMMGDAFRAGRPPKIKVKVIGTGPIFEVDLIKDQQFVYHSEPKTSEVEFEFVDNEPGSGESYYYVRIQQRDRNLAWSSPIWVDYR